MEETEGDATVKLDRLLDLQMMFWANPKAALRTSEIAERLKVSQRTALRYLEELSHDGRLPIYCDKWNWRLVEGASFDLLPVKLDVPEGLAVFAAAALLARQYNGSDQAIVSALTKLIAALPPVVRPLLQSSVQAMSKQGGPANGTTGTFSVLAHGWATQHVVQMTYEPLQGRVFTCRFAPYWLEPSGIGQTLYFLGMSQPQNDLRLYKLERVLAAQLTDEMFSVPADFDAGALLSRAWKVMYGDGATVHIKLRFSEFVQKRVRETRWHPSEQLSQTKDGLIWEADIGDITEIRPWIRGWGSDCQVLEPVSLREEMLVDIRKAAKHYGIAFSQASEPDKPNTSLLQDLFGEE